MGIAFRAEIDEGAPRIGEIRDHAQCREGPVAMEAPPFRCGPAHVAR